MALNTIPSMWPSTQIPTCTAQHNFLHVVLNTVSYICRSTQFLTCGAQHNSCRFHCTSFARSWNHWDGHPPKLATTDAALTSQGWPNLQQVCWTFVLLCVMPAGHHNPGGSNEVANFTFVQQSFSAEFVWQETIALVHGGISLPACVPQHP